jgi:hypothetical protein
MTDNPGVASSYANTEASFIRRRMTPEEIAEKYQPGGFVPDWGQNGLSVEALSQDNLGSWVVQGRDVTNKAPVSFRVSDEVYDRPNQAVSSYFLNSQKPFDMTKGELSKEEAVSILKALTDKFSYQSLADELSDGYTGFWKRDPEHFYEDIGGLVGKGELNNALKGLGYDAIRHTGGTRMGGGKTLHDVWIALNPEQVYEPFLESQVRGKWL